MSRHASDATMGPFDAARRIGDGPWLARFVLEGNAAALDAWCAERDVPVSELQREGLLARLKGLFSPPD